MEEGEILERKKFLRRENRLRDIIKLSNFSSHIGRGNMEFPSHMKATRNSLFGNEEGKKMEPLHNGNFLNKTIR